MQFKKMCIMYYEWFSTNLSCCLFYHHFLSHYNLIPLHFLILAVHCSLCLSHNRNRNKLFVGEVFSGEKGTSWNKYSWAPTLSWDHNLYSIPVSLLSYIFDRKFFLKIAMGIITCKWRTISHEMNFDLKWHHNMFDLLLPIIIKSIHNTI